MAADDNRSGTPDDHGRNRKVRDAAATEASKHGRLMRTARNGAVLSALMLPGFLVRPPTGFAVLTTTGRKTGKLRRKCIRVIQRGDRAYLVSLLPPALAMTRPDFVAGWVWNIRGNPRVRLRMPAGWFDGLAREITDRAELDDARDALCETVNVFDYGECAVHLRGLPTRAKIKDLHRYWFDTGRPLVIELRDAPR
ncbi:nitroreductase/quinone reductase family protein [Rhodococcus opacus]|uniref:nitroreductase/quinone reductase family protein n=1 Tax=Rhodococcus opacus TaxID=37919 RepID=UPI00295550A0|nr:nitroreductase/quinone reductase family protein [Rhodococcus opacus]